MALVFEYCFYVGVLLFLVGLAWTLRMLAGKRFGRLKPPVAVLLVGIALVIGPAVISRSMAVDLGPRETIVNNERHISLTGWDGDSYGFLSSRQDTVVLQMANSDVNDATLQHLTGMTGLREVDLNDSMISDAGLATLATLTSLERLRLRATKITDAGFTEHLAGLPNLMQLDLRETAVSAEVVEAWKAAKAGRRVMQ